MTVGNKAYIFDIHNSIFSTLKVDAACHPPKHQFNFVPMPQLKAFTMKYKSCKENYTVSNDIGIYSVSTIMFATYRAWYKAKNIRHGTLCATSI
jgi:hypothetical protein